MYFKWKLYIRTRKYIETKIYSISWEMLWDNKYCAVIRVYCCAVEIKIHFPSMRKINLSLLSPFKMRQKYFHIQSNYKCMTKNAVLPSSSGRRIFFNIHCNRMKCFDLVTLIHPNKTFNDLKWMSTKSYQLIWHQ